ncbi:hypothetical protein [Paenibacillus xylaniclasticus]|nr:MULTISPECIES: hypothetical protein [Paenibacillus]
MVKQMYITTLLKRTRTLVRADCGGGDNESSSSPASAAASDN